MKIILILLFFGIVTDTITAGKVEVADKKNVEEGRGFLSAIGSTINLISNIGTGIATGIAQTVNKVGNVISNKINQAVGATTTTIKEIIKVQDNLHKNTTAAIQGVATNVLEGISTHVSITKNLTSAIANAVAGHINKNIATTNYTLNTVVNLVETVIDTAHKHVDLLVKGASNNTATLVEAVGDVVKALVSSLNTTKINHLHQLPNLLLTGVTDLLTHLVNSTVSLTKVNFTQTLVSAFVKTSGNVVDSLIDVLLLVTNKTANATKHNFGHSSTALLHSISGLLDNLGEITKVVLKGAKGVLIDSFANKTDALVAVVGNLADLITDPAISFTESLVDKLNITSTILVDKIHDVFGAIFNISTDAVETIVDGVHKTVNGTAVTLLSKIPKLQKLVTNTTTKLSEILNERIKKHGTTFLALVNKVGTNGTRLMDKSLASIGKMLGNITHGFDNIIFTTKNALMSVVSTLGGTISTVAKGVVQLANNITGKFGEFVAGKLDCAADVLPMMVKSVQGLSNHTVGCAVSKLSNVIGNVVKNTTELAGITGKVFTGVTDHFEACVKNNSKKSFPQAACLTAFIGTTTNKTAMISTHLADTASKLLESIIGTGNITDCIQKTVGDVKETVIDFATCILSNTSKSARSIRQLPFPIPREEESQRVLVARLPIPNTDYKKKQGSKRTGKDMRYDLPEETFRSLINDQLKQMEFNIDDYFELPDLPLADDDWDI